MLGVEPSPLLIGEVLAWVGVKGSLVLVVSAVIAAYHGHSLLGFFARLGTWARVAGVFLLVGVVAYAGLIPGVRLSLDFVTLGTLAGRLWSWLPIPALFSAT